MNIETQMILRTLNDAAQPMTAEAITRHWYPSWSLSEVNALLVNLVQEGAVIALNKSPRQFQIKSRRSLSSVQGDNAQTRSRNQNSKTTGRDAVPVTN
jgi:hypothetical protein